MTMQTFSPYMSNQYPQYQPQINPYMERISNLQQYQQSLQPVQQQNTLGGKIVDSIDVVKATDIPMDGNLYYFPKADGTEIYAKSWLANGTTQILTFKPSFENQTSNLSQNDEKSENEPFKTFTEVFLKRFDDIETRFDRLEKSITTKQSPTRAKKESVTE